MTDLAILSHSRAYYSTRRLFEAAAKVPGLDARLIDPVRVTIHVDDSGCALLEDGEAVAPPDIVIPRIGATLAEWSLHVLATLCSSGTRSPVCPDAIRCAGDKLATQRRLVQHGVATVETMAVREPYHAEDVVAALGGAPLVLKLPVGTQGKTVMSAADAQGARSTLMALTSLGHTVLVQRRLPVTPARDLRVFLIGGRVRAACWRYAPPGDFRANIHRGGRAEPAELDDAIVDLAERAAAAVDLPLCGVDLIETGTPERPLAVMEINASPGLEGIEGATGRDLAAMIIDDALKAG